jgi:Na+-driven multidrug efflux pump
LAAINITNTIQNFFFVFCFSVASAALVMTGHQVGAGDREKTVMYAYRFTVLTGLLGLVLGLLILLSGPWLLSFFSISEGTARSAALILKIFGLTYFLRQINLVLLVGIFRGGGDAKVSLAMDLSTMWLLGVPLAFLGAVYWRLPVEQVVALITIEEVIKSVMTLLRLKSGKWIHDVTAGI